MSRFAAIKEQAANVEPMQIERTGTQANRIQKKAIAGYFSPEMSIAMRMTATRRGLTLQQAMAEAFNSWLRENGASPVGD